MSASGLHLDFTDEETDQTEMPAGERHGCRLGVRQDQLSWRWSSALCVADASGSYLLQPDPGEGEEGHWGAGVNPPPACCPDEVVCCFFLKD